MDRKTHRPFLMRSIKLVFMPVVSILACTALEGLSVPAMAANLPSNSSTSTAAPVFNSKEQQILRSLPNKDQTLLKNMMTVSNPRDVLSFDQQHAAQIHQLTTRHGAAVAQFLAASDVNQYLHAHPVFKFGSNTHVFKRFPDGSTLEYGSTTRQNSSSSHPLSLKTKPGEPLNTDTAALSSRITPTTTGYTNDNYAGETIGAYVDTVNFYVYYYSLLFVNAVGNPVGYGADIYNTWPDAAASGVGAICDYNGDLNIQANSSMNTSATTTYTVGFNIDGVTNTNTWQLESYWNGSLSTSSPFHDNHTPWVHT
ncbi:MAG: hypothetical protein M1294_03840 [Firmicutes bacterium]|jgi:hypothetical protein|nr:hypothetical protein [Bacillota bacterium]